MASAFDKALENAYGYLEKRPGQSDSDPSQFLSSAATRLKDIGRKEISAESEAPELVNRAMESLPDLASSNSGPGTFSKMPGSVRKEGPGSGNPYSSQNPGFFYGTQQETDVHQRAARLSNQAEEIQAIGLQSLKDSL